MSHQLDLDRPVPESISTEDLLDRIAMHIGQSPIDAIVPPREFGVVETE